MITEQYVTLETAKLLKEAGFDIPCFVQYTERATTWRCDCPENFNKYQCATSCPTQQLSARWLREVHGLNIVACFNDNAFTDAEKGWFYMREDTNRNDPDSVYCDFKDYKTYEEAIEAGLQESLKLIIKEQRR